MNIGGWMVHGLYLSTGINYDYSDLLKEIDAPVLVVYGKNDFITEAYEDYAALLPNSETAAIKDASHFPFNENPEEFKGIAARTPCVVCTRTHRDELPQLTISRGHCIMSVYDEYRK